MKMNTRITKNKDRMSFSIADFLKSGAIISLSQDQLLLGWGKVQACSSKEIDRCLPAFYLSDFFLTTPKPWLQYGEWMVVSTEEFKTYLKPPPLTTCHWIIRDLHQFKTAFHELSYYLSIGILKKAVPYLFAYSLSQMTTDRLQSCLKQGLTSLTQKSSHLYGYWNSAGGVLGVSPELLFSHSENQPQKVDTMALAGTCHASHCQKAFMSNEKERREHQLVVQGICQSLQTLGYVHVGETQLLRLRRLTHLMTPIQIELKQSFCFETIVRHLHPTPALGAFPFLEGRKWLKSYHKHTPRQYFGNPMGFKDPSSGFSQCLVSIRNVQWNASYGMRIGAGCGVVKHSQFDKEWKELQMKIRAVREQLFL